MDSNRNNIEGPLPCGLVARQVKLRTVTFDKLKAIQREIESTSGRYVTNAEVIALAVARWPLKGS